MAAPLIEAADLTVSGNNTASSSWGVSTPAASTGDLLIFLIGWDDSTNVTAVTPAAGPNGETVSSIAGPVPTASNLAREAAWYTVATGNWSAGTLTFTPNASEQWRGIVIKVPAGEFDSTTPIGASGTQGSTSSNSTSQGIPTFTLGSTDGGGRLVAFGVNDAGTTDVTDPSGWTLRNVEDIGAISTWISTRDAETTDSESITNGSYSWALGTGQSWATIFFVVRGSTNTRALTIGATETGADSASLQAKVTLATNIAATEAATKDTASLQAKVLLQASLSANEPQGVKDAASLQVSGVVARNATIGATEAATKDTASLQARVILATQVTATEAATKDTASIQTRVLVGSRIAATEAATKDTASIQTRAMLATRVSATESQVKDTAALQARALLATRVTATETGQDTASLQATLTPLPARNATLSASEAATKDTAALQVTVSALGARNATIGATEAATKDTGSWQVKVLAGARIAATEAATKDTAALQAKVLAGARVTATESGTDTAALQARTLVGARVTALETATDSATFAAAVLAQLAIGATEAGEDEVRLRVAGEVAAPTTGGRLTRFIQPFAS